MKFINNFSYSDFSKIKEYQPIIIDGNEDTRFYFSGQKDKVECTLSLVLYEQMLVHIAFKENIEIISDKKYYTEIHLNARGSCSSILQLILFKIIELEDKKYYLFNVQNVKLNISFLKWVYIKRMYNRDLKNIQNNKVGEFNFLTYKKLVSLYSIPQKVWLVSNANTNNLWNFPIDFCTNTDKHIIFGVRNSNTRMNSILKGDYFFISEAAYEDYEKIYSLGNFKADLRDIQYLKEGNTLLPDLICSYFKLELVDKIVLEHHSIYIASKQYSQELDNSKNKLAHLHKIWVQNIKS